MKELKCQHCGYTKRDMKILNMDHSICKGAGMAPWDLALMAGASKPATVCAAPVDSLLPVPVMMPVSS